MIKSARAGGDQVSAYRATAYRSMMRKSWMPFLWPKEKTGLHPRSIRGCPARGVAELSSLA